MGANQKNPDVLAKWKEQVGKYPEAISNDNNEQAVKSAFEQLGSGAKQKLLGVVESRTPLNQDNLSSTKARDEFLTHLHQVLSTQSKSASPVNSETITMEKLLGKDGLALYKAAILEENNSREFRAAVFNKSTKHYDGPEWGKKMVLWVGGPSASGKTFGTESAVRELAKIMPSKEPGSERGNDVVSVDGGIERELSQMRQMVLQVALSKNYKGIEDLHKNTKLTVKYDVQKAAVLSDNFHVVIPETFTATMLSGCNINIMKKFEKDDSVVQAFSEVNAPGHQLRFKNSVAIMGNQRAWNSQEFKESDIKMNNQKLPCESKIYEAENFKFGKIASAIAKNNYLRISKNPILISINHELLYLKQVNGKWKRCDANKDMNEDMVRIGKRDFENWKAYQRETPGQMQHPTMSRTQVDEKVVELESKMKNLDPQFLEYQKLDAQKSQLIMLDTMNETRKGQKMGLKEWVRVCAENNLLHSPKITLTQVAPTLQRRQSLTQTISGAIQKRKTAPPGLTIPAKPLSPPTIPPRPLSHTISPKPLSPPIPPKPLPPPTSITEKPLPPIPTSVLTKVLPTIPAAILKKALPPIPPQNPQAMTPPTTQSSNAWAKSASPNQKEQSTDLLAARPNVMGWMRGTVKQSVPNENEADQTHKHKPGSH